VAAPARPRPVASKCRPRERRADRQTERGGQVALLGRRSVCIIGPTIWPQMCPVSRGQSPTNGPSPIWGPLLRRPQSRRAQEELPSNWTPSRALFPSNWAVFCCKLSGRTNENRGCLCVAILQYCSLQLHIAVCSSVCSAVVSAKRKAQNAHCRAQSADWTVLALRPHCICECAHKAHRTSARPALPKGTDGASGAP